MSFGRLPQYSVKDEIWNTITHLVGVLFSLGTLIFFFIYHTVKKLALANFWPYYFYNLTMMVVFVISSLYHSSKLNSTTRLVFRIIDHSDIYLFVFGTYLPILMFGMTGKPLGLVMIFTQLGLTIIGILTTVIPHDSKVLKAIGFVCYIISGWLLVFFLPFGVRIPLNVFIPILSGGVVYSVGAILYGIGKKKIYMHTVFHIFVLLGAAVQFIGIYFLLTL